MCKCNVYFTGTLDFTLGLWLFRTNSIHVNYECLKLDFKFQSWFFTEFFVAPSVFCHSVSVKFESKLYPFKIFPQNKFSKKSKDLHQAKNEQK